MRKPYSFADLSELATEIGIATAGQVLLASSTPGKGPSEDEIRRSAEIWKRSSWALAIQFLDFGVEKYAGICAEEEEDEPPKRRRISRQSTDE